VSLLAAALLVTAGEPAASPPADNEQIVVMGRKLREWRGTWRSKKGVLSCQTKRSTKDAEIDAVGCRALLKCVPPVVPKMQAIAASKLPKAERQRQMDAASQALIPCFEREHQAGIAALADRRAGA
jgi:hypothetical protein